MLRLQRGAEFMVDSTIFVVLDRPPRGLHTPKHMLSSQPSTYFPIQRPTIKPMPAGFPPYRYIFAQATSKPLTPLFNSSSPIFSPDSCSKISAFPKPISADLILDQKNNVFEAYFNIFHPKQTRGWCYKQPLAVLKGWIFLLCSEPCFFFEFQWAEEDQQVCGFRVERDEDSGADWGGVWAVWRGQERCFCCSCVPSAISCSPALCRWVWSCNQRADQVCIFLLVVGILIWFIIVSFFMIDALI